MKLTFDYANRTGLAQDQILVQAKALKKAMDQRFGKGSTTLQQAIDSVIDAQSEYNQGA